MLVKVNKMIFGSLQRCPIKHLFKNQILEVAVNINPPLPNLCVETIYFCVFLNNSFNVMAFQICIAVFNEVGHKQKKVYILIKKKAMCSGFFFFLNCFNDRIMKVAVTYNNFFLPKTITCVSQ